jgi:hypothetical protein
MTVMAAGLSRSQRKGVVLYAAEEARNTLVSASQAWFKQGRPRNKKPAPLVQSELLKPEWLRRRTPTLEGPMLLIVLGVKDLSC